jgi:DNA-binding NarL/FixJ family response regulator
MAAERKKPIIKIAALSMNSSEQAIISMIKAGCCAYLMKNSHPEELTKALHEIHSKGYYNSDSSDINYKKLIKYEEEKNLLNITYKEKEFLQLACSDLTYNEIAKILCLSKRTIDGYRENLFAKLNVQSRVGLCLEAIRKNIVTI